MILFLHAHQMGMSAGYYQSHWVYYTVKFAFCQTGSSYSVAYVMSKNKIGIGRYHFIVEVTVPQPLKYPNYALFTFHTPQTAFQSIFIVLAEKKW